MRTVGNPWSVCRGVVLSCAVLFSVGVQAEELTTSEREYFEQHIRPVLAENCYKCHGGEDTEGDFDLTYREGIRESGTFGGNVVPGDPGKSGLLEALRYEDPDFQMPPTGKLPDLLIAHLEEWIAMGAPDPRDAPLSEAGPVDLDAQWAETLERRKSWWSYQPVAEVEPPGSGNPVDAFLEARWAEAGVAPAVEADPYVLIRRLSFVLTGLPPTVEEVDGFVAEYGRDAQSAVDAAVDRMLGSPRFGERWARHWMDWMRYAESHGSEGDPAIPNAWRYRNYLIRALNVDVGYDDLVREHLAGDLLPEPRVNRETGIVESVLGTAQFRFVQHGFAPTDALDELVRFTDNQIDTVSKAFLATTVSCARCHNHKFDPVSQTDFYALYGIMASTRPATVVVDTAERLEKHKGMLRVLKGELRSRLAEQWLADVEGLAEALLNPDDGLKQRIEKAEGLIDPLHTWRQLRAKNPETFATEWKALSDGMARSREAVDRRQSIEVRWDLGSDDAETWTRHGNGIEGVSAAGEFSVAVEGNSILGGVYPSGVYTHLLSRKHSGVFSSPRFELTGPNLFVRVAGDRNAMARYVVQNYPRDGTVYPVQRVKDGNWRWQHWNVEYWQGEQVYLELSTAPDQAVLANGGETRSWFGITEAFMLPKDAPGPQDEMAEFVAPLFDVAGTPVDAVSLAERYAESLRVSVVAWRDGVGTDAHARYLDACMRRGLLTNELGRSEKLDASVRAYRALEKDVPVPRRAPGVLENAPFDQPLFTRGNHTQPEERVARRFLEMLDDAPYGDEDAGRLALAESIVDGENPLTARVIANRIWHHVFGQGIVRTPDDFGAMGETPSAPELLDFLAAYVVDEGWSMKSVIRLLTTSEAFRFGAVATESAVEKDPDNRLFSHAQVRRLEAETIRDALLMTAGRLNEGIPEGSVDGGSDHRSVYVRVIRNNLDPFLTIFDAPVPVSTKGRRDVTNVPTHALVFMNDPFVLKQAKALVARVEGEDGDLADDAKAARLFRLALRRPPDADEMRMMAEYVALAGDRPAGIEYDGVLAEALPRVRSRVEELEGIIAQRVADAAANDAEFGKLSAQQQEQKVAKGEVNERNRLKRELSELEYKAGPPQPWVELAQSLFSLKEFSYLR